MEITSRDLFSVDYQLPQRQDPPSEVDLELTKCSASLLDVDLLIILTLLAKFGVPVVDLQKTFTASGPNVKGKIRAAHPLGTGLTCHVYQAETSLRTGDLLPPSTVVAVKAYLADSSILPSLNGTIHNRIYDLIRRELLVLYHPSLRYHDNICNLHFVSLEETNPLPLMALELTAYGSLDDVMQSSHSRLPAR